jgi:hypothetical protein
VRVTSSFKGEVKSTAIGSIWLLILGCSNFDDDRAAAGSKVLGDLAKKTQVIFFTHRQHLMALAESAIGVRPTVTMLAARDGMHDSSPGSLEVV